MKIEWLARTNGQDIIVFCNGWGMDREPVSGLDTGSCDVVCLYDYASLDGVSAVLEVLPSYHRRILICWSMGVWAGHRLFESAVHLFQRRIAVNGTLCPIDDRFGIPRHVFAATLADFSDSTMQRFYRRMCREPGVFEYFMERTPRRTLEAQRRELSALQDLEQTLAVDLSFYTDIVIARDDRIVPTENQLAFWQDAPVTIIDGCHYPFARWRSWQDIITLVGGDER